MSNSPFAAFANATLKFQVASGALVPDKNGNPRPGKAVFEVSALLDTASDRSNSGLREEDLAGVDSTAVYLEGFAVEPMLLPGVINLKSVAEAEWNGHTGRFTLGIVANSPYGDTEVLGHALKGYFQVASFKVEGDPWVPTPEPLPITEQREILTASTMGQTVFTLAIAPTQPQLSELYINGVKATYGLEYVLDGLTLTWLAADLTLQPEDEIEILYS